MKDGNMSNSNVSITNGADNIINKSIPAKDKCFIIMTLSDRSTNYD